LRPPAVLVPRSAQACGRSRALTGGDSMPILGFHPQRKEVIQCLTPSAVTSLGSPAKPSWAWQTGRSQRLDPASTKDRARRVHPAAPFFPARGTAINHALSQHLSSAVARTMGVRGRDRPLPFPCTTLLGIAAHIASARGLRPQQFRPVGRSLRPAPPLLCVCLPQSVSPTMGSIILRPASGSRDRSAPCLLGYYG